MGVMEVGLEGSVRKGLIRVTLLEVWESMCKEFCLVRGWDSLFLGLVIKRWEGEEFIWLGCSERGFKGVEDLASLRGPFLSMKFSWCRFLRVEGESM